jgi:prolyl oligopeptidase
LAFAHVRGGGEYGDDWHRAGMQAKKMNSIYDFLACAEYLVKHKYTSPQKLAGTGRSAGGLLIGRAITERPELFAAALILVGLSDPLRLETMQGGPENAPEFGTVTTKEGFHALFEMDPYQHVRRGTAYPAVLLASGANDSRVAVWQAAKMAARLQAASSSGRPVLLRIVYDSGHGFGSTRTQFDIETADEWSFLLWQLGDDDFHPHASGSN